MTRSDSENAVRFIGMKHLDSDFFSGSYGVLRGRVAMVIAAIMFALVFAGGANACHHNAETAEQTSTEVPQKTEKTEVEA
jgi:hypothetical protein